MLIFNILGLFHNFIPQIYDNFLYFKNCCIFVPAHEGREERMLFWFTIHSFKCLSSFYTS